MSKDSWTHCICGECWIYQALSRPEKCMFDDQTPVGVLLPVRWKMAAGELSLCCYCGRPTRFGAYIRDAPDAQFSWHPEFKSLYCQSDSATSPNMSAPSGTKGSL